MRQQEGSVLANMFLNQMQLDPPCMKLDTFSSHILNYTIQQIFNKFDAKLNYWVKILL